MLIIHIDAFIWRSPTVQSSILTSPFCNLLSDDITQSISAFRTSYCSQCEIRPSGKDQKRMNA